MRTNLPARVLLATFTLLVPALALAATPSIHNLGTLGGPPSYGLAINDAGQVAGDSQITGSTVTHAFRYDGTPGAGGVMRDLSTLGGTESYGLAVNDAGQVAGESYTTGNAAFHAFLYTGTPGAGGQMIDLDTWLDANNPTEGAKWTLFRARGLPDTGWITGYGLFDPDGAGGIAVATRAYLLDASGLVPEPSGLALVGLAVSALLRRQPRRRAHRSCCETLEPRRLLTFAPAASFSVNPNPQAVATADLNEDGRLDLVTSNVTDNTISVRLGNGSGGFGAARHFDAWLTPDANSATLTIADFTGDGDLDVVTVQHFYLDIGYVSLLPGNGDGTFDPAIFMGGAAYAAAAGRFNTDGYIDLVISAQDENGYGWLQTYLSDGQGDFTYPRGHSMFNYGIDLAVGYLDGDNKLDALLLTGNGFTVLGNGDGTFVSPYLGFGYETPFAPGARGLALGDFTGDNKLDAVVASQTVDIHRGHGDGMFDGATSHSANGAEHTAVAIGDFNADGKLDAVVTDGDTGTVSVMLGNGDGTLRFAGAFATGSSPSAIAVGDFNGDGRPDVAAANGGSNTVSVLLNDGVWPGAKTFVGPGGAGSGGNWSTASNWSPSGVPSATDAVAIAGKTVNLSANATVASLTLSGGAKLNLNDKQLTVNYSGTSPIGSWNGSAYTGITGMIQSGRNGGSWNGTGIVTSSASGNLTTLGVADVNGEVAVKFTYDGDANLDGKINIDDYTRIDSNIPLGTSGWFNGDFNYDGKINVDDYLIIDSNIGTQGPPLSGAAGASGDVLGAAAFAAERGLDLFDNSSNSFFSKKRSIGTILNDD
jgi:probable HAF family extracellular repeat protein